MDTNDSSKTDTRSTPTNPPRPPFLPKLSSILTKLSHTSAPFLSIFLVVHLSAPVVAAIGGSNAGSNMMLLGREYYQTQLGEPYLLLLPFAIHIGAGITKRVVLGLTRRLALQDSSVSIPTSVPAPAPASRVPIARQRPLTSPLALTAYTLLFIFLPIHVLTHRLGPSFVSSSTSTSTSTSIGSLGLRLWIPPPSADITLDLPKTALSTFPWRTWMLYTGLVGCMTVHWVEGGRVLMAKMRGGVGGIGMKRITKHTTLLTSTLLTLPVLAGLWRLASEPCWAMEDVVERYREALRVVWVYRL